MKNIKPALIGFYILLLTGAASAQSKYSIYCYPPLVSESLKIMVNQIGTIEMDNNSGARILMYQQSVGLPDHSPYCAAGQYFCFREACARLNIGFENIPIPRTGLANEIYNYSVKHGNKTVYSSEISDLIVWRKINSVHGHIERVISISKAGWVRTVGFNSSSSKGGKKAEGVFIQRRNIFHPIGKLRIRGLIGFRRER